MCWLNVLYSLSLQESLRKHRLHLYFRCSYRISNCLNFDFRKASGSFPLWLSGKKAYGTRRSSGVCHLDDFWIGAWLPRIGYLKNILKNSSNHNSIFFITHSGPEKLKESRPKKFVKSNKSISRNYF